VNALMMATSTAFNATNHGLQIGNNSGTITAEFHVARGNFHVVSSEIKGG
jgi:hypothetical protein